MKRKNKSWYKPKGYLHFSSKLSEADKKKVQHYIENNLSTHNFYPLIHETITARKYKKFRNHEGVVERNHFNTSKKKPNKKPREVFYANHLDAHIYSYFSNQILGVLYEKIMESEPLLSQAVLAYRKIPIIKGSKKNKSNIHFAKEVFEEISNRENCVAVCYDIENFFPSLSHTYLMDCWQSLLKENSLPPSHKKLFDSLTKYSYVEIEDIIKSCSIPNLGFRHRNDFMSSDFSSYFISAKEFRDKIAKRNLIKVNKPDKSSGILRGIPQGTPISAFLANLYLMEFDRFIIKELVIKQDCYYRRYSDDIVILFNSLKDFDKWDVQIRNLIASPPFSLTISKDKTVVSIFSKQADQVKCETKTEFCIDFSDRHPMRYLGFDFDGERILIKSSSLSKYYREMKESISKKSNRAEKARRYNEKHPEKPKSTKMYLTKLYSRFTHLGKNKSKSNFLTYVDRAAKEIYPDYPKNENPIRKQVRRSWSIFNKTIEKYKQ